KEHRISESDMLAITGKLEDKKINLAIKKTEEKRFWEDATLIAGPLVFFPGLYVYYANRPRRSRRGGRPSTNTYAMQHARTNAQYMMWSGLGREVVRCI